MVLLEKYHDEDDSPSSGDDEPPSYETISAVARRPAYDSGSVADEKHRAWQTTPPVASGSARRPQSTSSSSWFSMPPFTPSRGTSNQVRQTILALVRDLVLNVNADSAPNLDPGLLLCSCADACRTYGLDLSALLQERSTERHSVIYWSVLNQKGRHDTTTITTTTDDDDYDDDDNALLSRLLAYATAPAPLARTTVSEIRLACLATSNQRLFQSLRCCSRRESSTSQTQNRSQKQWQMAPLSTNPGTDAILLGAMPSDEVSIRETDGQGSFVTEMRINLWQKRMRVSGRVSIEFIARGRIWSLTFFSPPSTARGAAVGVWQVALCLLEHSPPTFIDSRLIIDLPPPGPSANADSSTGADAARSTELISLPLSPSPHDLSEPATLSLPTSSQPKLKSKSKSESKSDTPQAIQVRLKSTHRLAYRASNPYLAALDAAFRGASQNEWSRPQVEEWSDKEGSAAYTNAIVVALDDYNGGEELVYDNTPFVAADGALHVRFEARLARPDLGTDCVVC